VRTSSVTCNVGIRRSIPARICGGIRRGLTQSSARKSRCGDDGGVENLWPAETYRRSSPSSARDVTAEHASPAEVWRGYIRREIAGIHRACDVAEPSRAPLAREDAREVVLVPRVPPLVPCGVSARYSRDTEARSRRDAVVGRGGEKDGDRGEIAVRLRRDLTLGRR